MPIAVRDIRVSFIWNETAPALLAEPVPAAPLAFLGRSGSYSVAFRSVRTGDSDHGGLFAPWPATGKHSFWKYYLENNPPRLVEGRRAWKHLVPMRRRLRARLTADWLDGAVAVEGFHFPHGQALVVTARLAPGPASAIELFDAVRLAHRFRNSELRVRWEGESQQQKPLAEFADDALSRLRHGMLGPGSGRGTVEPVPYSVVTFVRATDVDIAARPAYDGPVHRALEAMTSWRQSWENDQLPALAETAGDIRRSPASHIMYVRRRGRAVWFPSVAVRPEPKLRSLSCFHRNQLFAALQVESLGGLLREVQRRISSGPPLSSVEDECGRYAAGILGRLYGGDSSTYRSGGCRAHMTHADLVPVTESVRQRYAMPPLH